MLTENDIVDKLAKFLKRNGYEIEQKLTTNQTGIDLIVKNQFEEVYIEAKGETSALQSSKRYGLPFNRNQVKAHIAVAILATMKVITSKPSEGITKVGIALPDNEDHRSVINEIMPALKKLEIKLYWISNTTVKIE